MLADTWYKFLLWVFFNIILKMGLNTIWMIYIYIYTGFLFLFKFQELSFSSYLFSRPYNANSLCVDEIRRSNAKYIFALN
jgi:hypothetical protein